MKLISLLIMSLIMGCGDETTKKASPAPVADIGSDIGPDIGADMGIDGAENNDNNEGNRGPTFLNLPETQFVVRGESGAFELEASDPDGDALSFGLVDTDCPFEVQVIATSGRATWLCPPQTLSCVTNMSVKDDAGLVGEGALSMECVRPDPVISSVAPTEAVEATLLVYTVECLDPEGATLTITKGADDTCNGMIQGNAYRWTPSTNQADQSCILSVECSNPETSATQSSEVNVLGINEAPSASNIRISPTAPTQPGQPLTCLYTFDDPDGDADQSTIEWLVNGAVSGSGATFSDYQAGESVRCRVTPYDGDLSGPSQISGPLVFEWELLIRASNEYTCVRTRLGGVRCWGHNRSGVIGSSTTGFRSVHPPTTPPGLTSNVSQLTTGYDFACAVQANDLKCWGSGDIAKQNTHIPTTILSGGVTNISGGLNHMCVVQNGAAKCWGSNSAGQLGLGFSDFSNVDDPTTVPGLESGVTKIVVGEMSTCAVQNGALKCWGSNLSGQCGVSTNFATFDDLTSPVQVQGLGANTTDLWGPMAHTCALHNGTLKCFGNNGSGQLGRGTTTDEWSAATATAVPAGFTELELGRSNTCFLASGTLRCFGGNNGIMLGFAGASSLNPLTVLTSVGTFSLGSGHACAERNGVISCWGNNNYGQLGNGVGTGNDTPQGLTQVTY